MPSPTYALTSPSSQDDGRARSWKSSTAATNGCIAAPTSAPSRRRRSPSTRQWWHSLPARRPGRGARAQALLEQLVVVDLADRRARERGLVADGRCQVRVRRQPAEGGQLAVRHG